MPDTGEDADVLIRIAAHRLDGVLIYGSEDPNLTGRPTLSGR
jgi:hypothetical protein